MKTKNKISVIAAIALFLFVGLFAFKAKSTSSITPGVYYFEGTSSAAGWDDEDNWQATAPDGPACDSGDELPCRISISPTADLQQFLNSHQNLGELLNDTDYVTTKEME